MSTLLTHGIVGYTIAKLCVRKPVTAFYWVLAFVAPMLPDLDILAHRYGIRYEDCWGHRGVFHSIVMALLVSTLLFFIFQLFAGIKSFRLSKDCFLGLFLGLSSHGMIDALTNGGRGIAIFWPFTCQRFFFGFRPLEVSPLNLDRFWEQSIFILKSEALWVWLPCFVILWLSYLAQRASLRKGS